MKPTSMSEPEPAGHPNLFGRLLGPSFERVIIGVILLAGLVIGLETSPAIMQHWGDLLHALDKLILGIFIFEVVVKMGACWPRPLRYFRSGWNCFDFTIVVACLLPSVGPWAAVLRLFRVLRVVRLVSAVPKLQVLVDALLRSLPSMGYVGVLLMLHFYIYAVLGVFFFRGNDPGHFGDLGLALLTLFRVVTLEDWTDVMYSAIYGTHVYAAQGAVPVGPEPYAFGIWAVIYFVSFVLVGAMVMINLFVGVMVNSIAESQAKQIEATVIPREEHILASIGRVEEELGRLKQLLRKEAPAEASEAPDGDPR